AFRLERLEQGTAPTAQATTEAKAEPEPAAEPEPVPVPVGGPGLELSQLQEAWALTVLPAVEERGGIPAASLLREAHPAELEGDTLTLEFPPSASFHLSQAQDPMNAKLLADALYDVTGRRLELAFEIGEAREAVPVDAEEPAGED